MSTGILEDVRRFLGGLRRELPELFRGAPCAPPAPSRHPEALVQVCGRVEHWSGRMGVPFANVRVRDQRSLWGSCSAKGNLSFNWRLTLAPPEVLDYVVIHELAHRLEMNHSSRFWSHVERFCPEHRERRRWLRREGRGLLAQPAAG